MQMRIGSPKRSIVAITLAACALAACARPVAPQTAAAAQVSLPETKVLVGRLALLDALWAQRAFTPPRMVVHVAHVCSLVNDGITYPVVDIQELVRGAVVPRGVNSILVLTSELKLLRRIDYATERPLFCRDNRLYVWGALTIEGVPGEGNEITLGTRGEVTKLAHIEANDVPAPIVGVERPR